MFLFIAQTTEGRTGIVNSLKTCSGCLVKVRVNVISGDLYLCVGVTTDHSLSPHFFTDWILFIYFFCRGQRLSLPLNLSLSERRIKERKSKSLLFVTKKRKQAGADHRETNCWHLQHHEGPLFTHRLRNRHPDGYVCLVSVTFSFSSCVYAISH